MAVFFRQHLVAEHIFIVNLDYSYSFLNEYICSPTNKIKRLFLRSKQVHSSFGEGQNIYT